jgi:hypothetical protein
MGGVTSSSMAPSVVKSLDLIGGLIDSLADRLRSGNPEAIGLLPRSSQGRSNIFQCSTQPGSSRQEIRQKAQSVASRLAPGGSRINCLIESAFRVHHSESGCFHAMASTICTVSWMQHPLLALVVCLTEDTQEQLIGRLKQRWLEVAPTSRGKPLNGHMLEFAVVTVQQLREGIPLSPETALLPPEKMPGGPLRPRAFREVFLARDLSEGGDARAILEAVGRAQLGLHLVCPHPA